MTSARESKLPTSAVTGIPTAGSTGRRKSLLPGPKSFGASRIKSPTAIPASTGAKGNQPATKSNPTFAVPTSVAPQSKALVRQTSNEKSFVPGDICCVSGVKKGVIRYFGKVHFAEGEWCGIELNEPEGKHDGLVEGVRYFTCSEKHGLFAPLLKVESITVLSSQKEPTSVSTTGVVKLSKDSTTNQRRKSTLLKPGQLLGVTKTDSLTNRTRSRSPIGPKKVQNDVDSQDIIGNIKKTGKQLGIKNDSSKISSRSAVTCNKGKAESQALVSNKSSSILVKAPDKTDSNKGGKSKLYKPKPSGKFKSPKPASLVKGTKDGGIVKKSNNSTTQSKYNSNSKKSAAEVVSINIQNSTFCNDDLANEGIIQNSTFNVDESKNFNSTFVKDNTILIESTSAKAVNESVKSVIGLQKNLNSTYNKDSNITAVGNSTFVTSDSPKSCIPSLLKSPTKAVQSPPIPDLVQPLLCHESDSVLDFAGDIMSETEDKDILTTSQFSHASSVGILTDNQLNNSDLLSTKYDSPSIWSSAAISKCNRWIDNEIDDKELDLEIAGISTPEQDVSSRSSTGREDSSPEPDVTQPVVHTTLELTFQVDQAQTSTPTSPVKTDHNINECQGVKPKLRLQKTFVKCESPLASGNVNTKTEKKPFNATYVALKDGNANEVKENDDCSPEEYPKRMRTSSEFDHVENVLSASFELAKTAVEQYASLVKGAEHEKALSLRKKDQRLSLIEIRRSSFDLGDIRDDKKQLRHSFHEDLLRKKPSSSQTDISSFELVTKSFENKPLELKHNNSDKQLMKATNIDSVHNDIDSNCSVLKQTLDTHEIGAENHIVNLSSSAQHEQTIDILKSHNNSSLVGDNNDTNNTEGEKINLDEIGQEVTSYDDSLPSSELNTPGDYVELIKPENRRTLKQGIFVNTPSKHEAIEGIGVISSDTVKCTDNTNLQDNQLLTDNEASIERKVVDNNKATSVSLLKSFSNSFEVVDKYSTNNNNKERPVSIVSTGSVDTGIYSEDYNGGDPDQHYQSVSRESSFSCGMDRGGGSMDSAKEDSGGGQDDVTGEMEKTVEEKSDRPVSMVSASSVDTGYQPDLESEQTESATTSSPTSVESATLKDDVKNLLSQGSPLDEESVGIGGALKTMDDTQSVQSLDPDSTAIDNKEFPEEMTETTEVNDIEDHMDKVPVEMSEAGNQGDEVTVEDGQSVETDGEEQAQAEMPELQSHGELSHAANMSVDKETEEDDEETDHVKPDVNPTTAVIENTIRDTFILPDEEKEDIYTVPQDISVDNENNEANSVDNYTENLLHDENTQNENEEYFEDEVIPVIKVDEDLDMIETQSADTEPPQQKADEIDMLDMSWDNTEFTQIRDKLVTEAVNSDAEGDCDAPDAENMEMEYHDSSGKSVDVSSSAKEDVLSSGEGDTSIQSTKGPQKRKSKSSIVSVKETKSSKLRGSRDSPEKVVEKDSKFSKIGSPRKDTLSKLPGSKVPTIGTSPSKLKRHSYAGLSSQQRILNAADTSQKNLPDKNKSAITGKPPQSRLSSHLRRPSNPVGGSKAASAANSDSKMLNISESKIKSKLQTKAIQKRKTDSLSSNNPVPNKKAANYSSSKAPNSKHSTNNTDGLTTTSKQNDLNSSVSSAHSAGSKVSIESGENPAPKKNPVKSRLASLNTKVAKGDSEHGPGKTGIKSRLGIPQARSAAGGKKVGEKDENQPTSPRPGSRTPKSSTSGPTVSATRSRLSGPASKASSRLVTSTPKSSVSYSQQQPGSGLLNGDVPDGIDLNVSDMSYSGNMTGIKSKTLTGKPPHRATMSLKSRERSVSLGSDSQISVTSTVSTLSNISRVSSQGSSRPTAGRNSIAGTQIIGASSFTMQQSRRLPGVKKRSSSIEPKKGGLSVTAAGKIGTKGKPTAGTQPLASSSPKKSNQNRNKPGSAPTRASHLSNKRSQPASDLVSNSAAREEISRLEALCESRTKELNYAKMQLKQSSAGFEAMSVLVKYLTEELDAFSLPEVTSKLQETSQRLSEAHRQLQELTGQRDALIEEIKCLKDEHQLDTSRMEQEHSKHLQTLKETLTAEKQQELLKENEKHAEQINSLESSYEQQIEELKTEHDQLMEETHQQFENEFSSTNTENETRLSELQKQHADALGDITKRFEDIKMILSEKVECLRGECEMLRKREKEYMECFQRDSDSKVQIALRPYQHLPQEIDSLKAVLEMKNQEIHALRREKLENERRLEALPKAHDKIKSLYQKNENLEAIINIRTDYERSLAEKHQVLLRKFDKESKANKRLSMENEEIQWRISQGPDELQSVLNRSISHSPTSSAASTPEPTRRKKSPLPPQSPRSPRTSGSEFDKFGRSPRSSTADLDKRSSTRSFKSNSDLNSPRSSGSDFDRIYSPRNSGNNLSGYDYCNKSQDSAFIMSTSTQSEPSCTSSSTPKTNLKRSGTYELLNEEAELNGGHSPTSSAKQTDV